MLKNRRKEKKQKKKERKKATFFTSWQQPFFFLFFCSFSVFFFFFCFFCFLFLFWSVLASPSLSSLFSLSPAPPPPPPLLLLLEHVSKNYAPARKMTNSAVDSLSPKQTTDRNLLGKLTFVSSPVHKKTQPEQIGEFTGNRSHPAKGGNKVRRKSRLSPCLSCDDGGALTETAARHLISTLRQISFRGLVSILGGHGESGQKF